MDSWQVFEGRRYLGCAIETSDSWHWKGLMRVWDEYLHIVCQHPKVDVHSTAANYAIFRSSASRCSWWRCAWANETLPRHGMLTWFAMRGKLKTRDQLKRMNLVQDASCLLCQQHDETHTHLFSACAYSRKVIWGINDILKRRIGAAASRNWFPWVVKQMKGKSAMSRIRRRCHSAFIYMIWQERNARLFHCGSRTSQDVVRDVRVFMLQKG